MTMAMAWLWSKANITMVGSSQVHTLYDIPMLWMERKESELLKMPTDQEYRPAASILLRMR
jgi:hypothetical protein